MKNLKKLVSIVLSLSMLIGVMAVSVSAKSYSDVETSAAYFEAVDILSGLKILEGDEEGNFNPDAEIKRSEFAAVVCRALGQENAANGSKGFTKFSDVSTDHWAVGYINWAAQQKIVNGIGDNQFAPDAPVKYQEAVKMLVAALGYEPMATRKGGYPTGYMVVAASNNMGVSGVGGTENAARKVVAQLTYQALDVPLMDASYFSTSGADEYLVYNGKNGTDPKTILSQYLTVAKIKADVTATARSNDNYYKKNGEQVQLKMTACYTPFTWDDLDYVMGGNGDFANNRTLDAMVGETNAGEYLGYKVVAYVGFDDDDNYTLYAITPDSKSNNMLTVEKDIEEAIYNANGTSLFTYWEDVDNDRDPEEVEIAEDFDLYVNGVEVSGVDAENFKMLEEANKVVFMGDKSSDEYDKIFATFYTYQMVVSVNTEEELIETNATTIDLNKDTRNNDKFIYTITMDGEPIELGDLQENDVLNIVKPCSDIQDVFDANYDDDINFLDIIVTRSTVEGMVDGKGTEDDEYYIDGTEYKLAKDANALTIGDTGVFYLTIDGKILDMTIGEESGISGNYAFVTDVGANRSFGKDIYEVRMYTKNGSFETYPVASKLKVTYLETTAGEAGDKTTWKSGVTLDRDKGEQDALFKGENAEGKPSIPETEYGIEAYNFFTNIFEKNTEEAAAKAIQKRFINYKIVNNELKEIKFAREGATSDKSIFNSSTVGNTFGYNASLNRFGSYNIVSNSVLFLTPLTKTAPYYVDDEKIELMSFSSLDEDRDDNYKGIVYGIDSNRNIGAALIYEDIGIAASNALAVVQAVSSGLNADGEEATRIKFLQGKNINTLAINEDIGETADFASEVGVGDIIQFTLAGDEISRAKVIFDQSTMELKVTNEGNVKYVFGIVKEFKNWNLGLTDEVPADASGNIDKEYEPVFFNVDKDENSTLALMDLNKIERQPSSAIQSITSLRSPTSFKANANKYLAVARVENDDVAKDVVEIVVKNSTTIDELDDLTYYLG